MRILDFKKELEKLELLNAEAAEVIKKNLSMFTFMNIRTAEDLYIYTQVFFHVAAKYPYQIRQTSIQPDGLCLLYTSDGEGLLTLTDGTQFHLTAHCLCFWPQRMTSNVRIIASHWNHYILIIQGSQLPWFLKQLCDTTANAGILRAEHSKIPHMLHACETARDFSIDASLYNLNYTTFFLSEVIRLAADTSAVPDIPEYLQDIRRSFDKNYSHYYSLDILEKKYSVNKYRLAKEFTHYYGIAPISYLSRRRIEAAKGLLLSTNMKIHEIASQVGYENPTHFINAFKKQAGMTPLIYRKLGAEL